MAELHEYFNYEDADADAVADLLEIVANLGDDETLDSPNFVGDDMGEPEPADKMPAATGLWETIATAMIHDVEAWLDLNTGAALARNVARMMPTSTIAVPELALWGYHAEVGVEVDLDSDRRVADITVLLRPLDPQHRAISRIKVLLGSSSGGAQSAMVSRFGVAHFGSVPVTDVSPRDLTFTWLANEPS